MHVYEESWDQVKDDDTPIRTAYNMRRCWTSEDKLKLIYLAEKHNVLWDTSYPFYRELTRRKKALDHIRQSFDDKYCGKFLFFVGNLGRVEKEYST